MAERTHVIPQETKFAVTLSAFGSQVTTDNPAVNTSLMEPGESWNFIIDITNGVQVSDNTYLNMTCADIFLEADEDIRRYRACLTTCGPARSARQIAPD